MTVVGLDPSLVSFGVTCLTHGHDPITHLATSRGSRTDTWQDRQTRITQHRNNVMRLIPRNTELACIEGPAYSRGADPGAWDRAHLWWLIIDALTALQIPYAVVPSTTLKKHICDRGNAKKAEVVAAIARMWPNLQLPTDDAADAAALATIAAQHCGYPLPFLILERHKLALAKIVWPQLTPDGDTLADVPAHTADQNRMTEATR